LGLEEREKLWNFMKSKRRRMHGHISDQVVYIRYTKGLLNDIYNFIKHLQ
jgi:hypothetical protein